MSITRGGATALGFIAILMWATLAAATSFTGAVPPFQLVAMTMAIGGSIGLVRFALHPPAARALRAPLPVWLLGVYGLFGYHFFYFTALKLAPPVEANLVNYLWPLLIVLLSAALPGERLRAHHVAGALLGFVGAAMIVTRGGGLEIDPRYLPGYAAALVCAVVWSTYSVMSRRFQGVPTDTVAGFCLATAVLAALCHAAFETTVWPAAAGEWIAIVLLGLLPTGVAFYVWDIGMKRGDIQVLGAASYSAPVLSTLLLVAVGRGEFTPIVFAALALVTIGAIIASKDMIFRKRV
jgi:drug/metabolite transporter (DMT)-like permease